MSRYDTAEEKVMEQLSKKIKQNLPLVFIVLGGLLIIGAVLVAVFGAGSTTGVVKVLYIILTALMGLLGCTCIYFSTLISGEDDPNFFLYDPKIKANISADDLTFESVDRKMTYFMSHLTGTVKEIWESDVIGSDNEMFGESDEFRPLAAYKALYDLSMHGNDALWQLYTDAEDDVIVSIVDALALAGDTELGKAVRYLHKNSGGESEKTKRFLSDNTVYIRKKMLKYVKDNINKF